MLISLLYNIKYRKNTDGDREIPTIVVINSNYRVTDHAKNFATTTIASKITQYR